MRSRWLHYFTLIVCIALPASVAYSRTTKEPDRHCSTSASNVITARRVHGKSACKSAGKNNRRKLRQQAMEAKRVREIQAALIREDYLKGRANGVWDQRSQDAMTRFQSDNRWQSKVVPDSRALIKLGLGPDHAGLINPDTAAFSFIPGGGSR